ncbi:MAG: CBS domain-containing protein [Chloroflexi bacterium]|nr:CBS domain-containing protein [Chloroflexota bacterium]
MKVKECMKHKVFSIPATATIRDAATVFVAHHVGLLPVVDEQGKPMGVISLRKLLTLELPDFINLIADVDFVHDFGAVETTRPTLEELDKPVTALMEPVMTIPEDCGLLRAYALMLQHNLLDFPVVNKTGKLVGIVSLVDIGTRILSFWPPVESKNP